MRKEMFEYVFPIAAFIMLSNIAFAEPVVTSAVPQTTFTHGATIVINGSGFGSKNSQNGAAPVAFGDMENNSLSARIGSWSNTGILGVSTAHQRNSRSSHNAVAIFNDQDQHGSFQGGSDSPQYFAQYWFYLDPSDWNWGASNIKMFRMWSTGESASVNFVLVALWQIIVTVEHADEGHGGFFWGSSCPPSPSSTTGDLYAGWWPVIPGGTCADVIFGGACNCSEVIAGTMDWRNFQSVISTGNWHLFQFEYRDGDIDIANGIFRWWVDGRKVFDHTDLTTRTAADSSYKRPNVLGFYNSHLEDGSGHFYIDDAYIDNTFQRVEIGNNPDYDSCTLREIQPATSWNNASIAFTCNQGSFADGSAGYIFVTDANGARNTGYNIIFGSSNITPPAAPTGLAVN